MSKRTRRSKKTGLPPGSIVHVGKPSSAPVKLTAITYDTEHDCAVRELADIEEVFPLRDGTVTWINVDGIHRIDLVEKIGAGFKIHPLLLEDIVHADQRPKVEDFGDYVYVVLRMWHPQASPGNQEVHTEQVSLLVGQRFVITFQEDKEGDVFDPVRQRLKENKGRIRRLGADYLAYALIDVIVDNYFSVLERIGDQVESLELELIAKPTTRVLQRIYEMKRNLILLRKSVWPLREVISGLQRGESPVFQPATQPFLRDVYDHTIQVVDTVETLRDLVSGMLDIYLSSVSYRLNEVMKVLTIIATIFIPLTFIAGVYGMNFRHMPELEWRWGYAAIWGIMLAAGGGMVLYFKRRNWF